ncbi:response regulator [Sphingobacterium sp. 18053]|uniref:response regulator n=1 Tax=Sphingobacterium sp. 18053 TaxID=2681401 RepID=UPI00135CE200|nr:response regulator [Sphingobacterium sp. 18053]
MDLKTILIFDDDINILEVCSIVLEQEGYHVETSETTEDVLERVEDVHPDLILMDNWIPTLGGVHATKLLKAHQLYNEIPVVLLSANYNLEKLALEAGADNFLAKPFDLEDLEHIVREMLFN